MWTRGALLVVLLATSPAGAGVPPVAGAVSAQAAPGAGPARAKIGHMAAVEQAERLLADLGYWAGPADGRLDAASRHALVAFQKVEGRDRTGKVTAAELAALEAADRPLAREGEGARVEIDIARQVLFVVGADGAVERVLPVSTGNGKPYSKGGMSGVAVTPRGRFRVGRKIAGWHRSPLGLMYYPSYFSGGYAIHGSRSVPATPASHGCVRVPMYAAKELSEGLAVGTPVIIY